MNNLGANTNPDQRAHLQSVAFQTLSSARSRNSICPSKLESEWNQTWAFRATGAGADFEHIESATYDHRLEWQCQCQAGFTGLDCSQLEELNCNNERDDDNDGLIDCEDDDCCSQQACRDHHMCFTSPEPTRVLAHPTATPLLFHDLLHQTKQPRRASSRDRLAHNFYLRHRFFIANKSVQSYPNESSFDRSRVAIVRGRVTKWRHLEEQRAHESEPIGIVSVRVSVAETPTHGFTLTRKDGYFDILVNGDDWITLSFLRNAYAPIERRLFVRPNSINLLEENVAMWLASGATGGGGGAGDAGSTSAQTKQPGELQAFDSTFNFKFGSELYKLLSSLQKNDERRRDLLFECLMDSTSRTVRDFRFNYEPLLVGDESLSGQPEPLRTFVFARSGSFQTQLEAGGPNSNSNSSPNNNRPIQLVYNSASFPPAASVVKPSLFVQLLPDRKQPSWPHSLSSIVVQIDIEGQTRRERLIPLPKLSYQFAWNRRNVYGQKVYGFVEMKIRVAYEFTLNSSKSAQVLWRECANTLDGGPNSQRQELSSAELDRLKASILHHLNHLNRQLVWFERTVYVEAHQLNQHADLGKWNLGPSNRLDLEREVVYFGSGWSLPYKLVYPPVISDPIHLIGAQSSTQDEAGVSDEFDQVGAKLMARGPHSSMFLLLLQANRKSPTSSRLIQLDSSGKRRLLDLPLAILTGKLGLAQATHFGPHEGTRTSDSQARDDLQLIYNQFLSRLYLSSKSAGKIVQVSYSSLVVLDKAFSSNSATTAAEDEVDIEPLCGFGRQILSLSNSSADSFKPAKLVHLSGPHSLALDEERQILYFIDGDTNVMALDLVSNLVGVIPVSVQRGGWSASQQPGPRAFCRRHDQELQYVAYKPMRMHSLQWSRADSSLYFVDGNLVLALRQDYSLEIVARGSGSGSVASACLTEGHRLGIIRAIAMDSVENDLLVVHQWVSNHSKLNGRLYLAKLKLGIRSVGNTVGLNLPRIIDIHSGSSTWDPMVMRMFEAGGQTRQRNGGTASIKWNEITNTTRRQEFLGPHLLPNKPNDQSTPRPNRIPFIHLSSGFKQIDSLEINSDGSIFVLDLGTHSIRLIVPYSPNDFNLVERHDVNINRLFVANGQTKYRRLDESERVGVNNEPREEYQYQDQDQGQDQDRSQNADIRFASLMVQNPITNELMEFHSSTGLQLSSISSPGFKLEFYYQICESNTFADMDEDDQNDLDAQKLALDFLRTNANQPVPKATSIRLWQVFDSVGNEYEMVRMGSGPRLVLQSILMNRQPICKIATDSSGMMNLYKNSIHSDQIELVYDFSTCLLRDLVVKIEQTQIGAASGQVSGSEEPSLHGLRQLKRIVYDRIFYHYCDLFVVDT